MSELFADREARIIPHGFSLIGFVFCFSVLFSYWSGSNIVLVYHLRVLSIHEFLDDIRDYPCWDLAQCLVVNKVFWEEIGYA